MGNFKVIFFGKASKPMDYSERQRAANRQKVDLYVEQHFNASANTEPDYAVVVVGSNASKTSKAIGREYVRQITHEFGNQMGSKNTGGLLIGGFNGRGDGNIKRTNMPAILLEPLFCSNPAQAEIIRSEDGRIRLAQCLVRSIRKFFPSGATVGFSIGHKYKRSNPRDRGAVVVGGGTEADYAEDVLLKASAMLVEKEVPEFTPNPIPKSHTIEHGDTLWAISKEHGVSVEKLREWNPDINERSLEVGQILRLL